MASPRWARSGSTRSRTASTSARCGCSALAAPLRRSYSCPVNGRQVLRATGLAAGLAPRGRSSRRLVSGTLTGLVVYAPWLAAELFPLDWRWAGGFSLDYGGLLAVLPSVVLVALLAPRVAYRRRDALLLLLPPCGFRIAWVIGTRLGQLPRRDWPERADTFPVHGRHAARIAAAAYRYRSWRQRRATLANPAQPAQQPQPSAVATQPPRPPDRAPA